MLAEAERQTPDGVRFDYELVYREQRAGHSAVGSSTTSVSTGRAAAEAAVPLGRIVILYAARARRLPVSARRARPPISTTSSAWSDRAGLAPHPFAPAPGTG
jgi:hypothetical protein